MITKTIKPNMNLIELDKKGKLDEVIEFYNHKDEYDEYYMLLLKHFQSYFPEIFIRIPNPSEIERRSHIFEDPLFNDWNELASIYLGGKKNPHLSRDKYPEFAFPDEIGQKFYDKFFTKGYRGVWYTTTLEEAKEYGNEKIINFIIQQNDKEKKKMAENRKIAEEKIKNSKQDHFLVNMYSFSDIEEKIIKLCKEKNISLDNICKKYKMTSKDMSIILHHALYPNGDVSFLIDICNIFDVPMDYFVMLQSV